MGSLTLADYSDFEVLYALEDAYDEEGWATSAEVAEQIGLDAKHPAVNVGQRLGWANRFGVMEQRPGPDGTEWRLNEKGEALLHPDRLPAVVHRALEGMDEGQRLAVTDWIATQMPGSSRQAAHLAKRAWVNRFTANWRDPRLARKRAATA